MKPIALIMTGILLSFSGSLKAEDEAANAAASTEAIYIELKPAFVTNYQARKIGYFKTDVTLKVKGEATATAIEHHGPVIRHNLVMLFSRQDQEALNSTDGKLKLKEDALNEIIMALESEGEPSAIEDILFTSFIVD